MIAKSYYFIIDSRAHTLITYLGMNMICKVKYRSTLREFIQVAFGCKDKHLILIQIHLELIHHLEVITSFQNITDIRQPVIQPTLTLDTLVSPVGSHTTFGNLIHTFSTYLYLHPFLFRSEHCDMQTLIAIAFRHRKPVTQSFRIRLIHIRNDGIYLPALHLLLLYRSIQNNTDSKKVIDTFKATLLFLHLLPDTMNGLGTSLHVEFQSGFQ